MHLILRFAEPAPSFHDLTPYCCFWIHVTPELLDKAKALYAPVRVSPSCTPVGPNGLRLKGLKEYSDSYLTSDYLGPILGSKCLVMQTLGNYLGLGPSEETSENMFQAATRTFNLLYYFPFMLLIGLTSLASIYSQTPVLFKFSFEINFVHSKLLSSVFPLDSGPI
jgi:hypothetical protein